jgi:NAD(P)-dependent dehydrogenase (short-subunit alcohol dehydrogenase family)
MSWRMSDMVRQDGRRALVTGGASGIGFQVARELGAKGARVVITARDATRGQLALAELRRAVPGGDFDLGHVDLADLRSIAAFAEGSLGRGEPLDLLVNAAGVMAVPTRTTTVDGFEMHMGTNHLGHFALTGRLLPALRRGKGGRIVRLDLADLQSEKRYGPMRAYGASKLANVLFAVELQRRASSIGLSSVALDPGTANTSLQRHGTRLTRLIGGALIDIIGYPIERVAEPVLFAATVAEPGESTYVGPGCVIQRLGSPALQKLPKPAFDGELRAELWRRSEELTGVHYHFC